MEKYDESDVHAKLDKLVEHATETSISAVHDELLEQIKLQVEATAAEFSTFVAMQKAAITESQDSHAREAEEAAIALEKRTAQKEQVEADIIRLSDEKLVLYSSVDALKKQEHDLALQKARLQAELSSLETALHIRREEMQLMEARAEGLERRILEGVLDHSRSLLMSSRSQSSLKAMNLKRVTSTASNATTATSTTTAATTVPSTANSALSQGLSMALKRRQPLSRGAASRNSRNDRRILSLSTIDSNKGPATDRSLVLVTQSSAGTGSGKGIAALGSGGLKRSHSVKSNFPVRKTSWGGTRQAGMYADEFEEDKENSILDEEDEENISDGGTERRTSFSTETDRKTSYSETYTGTGTYGTGSVDGEDERRTSYATSTVCTVGLREAKDEEDKESNSGGIEYQQQDSNQGMTLYHGEMGNHGLHDNEREVVVFSLPSDSGIGTDLPTAALDGGHDYFRKD